MLGGLLCRVAEQELSLVGVLRGSLMLAAMASMSCS